MRKICVITGSRADHSPMASVIEALGKSPDVEFFGIITTGLFGHEDFIKNKLIEIKPDIVVVLGDRYEILVAASVAALLCIPVAHIGGGDETQGAVDNCFRHAITKLSYWHFPIHARYAQRLAKMGESWDRIHVLGDSCVDNLVGPMTMVECNALLDAELRDNDYLLATFHPQTISTMTPEQQADEFFGALDVFWGKPIVLTGCNADPGNEKIKRRRAQFVGENKNVIYRDNYERRLYNSLMAHCQVVVGNSSSGVIEASVIPRPSVTVGDRQKGRLRFTTIIDTPCKSQEIHDAIKRAMVMGVELDYSFNTALQSHFGKPGQVGAQIADVLAKVPIPSTTEKAFCERGQ